MLGRPPDLHPSSPSPHSYSFTGLDTETFKACPSVPCASSFPNAFRWYLHIAALSGIKTCVPAMMPGSLSSRQSWAPPPRRRASLNIRSIHDTYTQCNSVIAGGKPAAKGGKAAPAKKAAADDDDVDLFGDDDVSGVESRCVCGVDGLTSRDGLLILIHVPPSFHAPPMQDDAAAKPALSRAEQIAKAKADKEAKEKANKKRDRSQIVLEVKPVDTDVNLDELYATIKKEISPSGLTCAFFLWGGVRLRLLCFVLVGRVVWFGRGG